MSNRVTTDKRVIRTKESIRLALFKLMESKDVSSITITELTSAANINRRTFYTHYDNITQIIDETEQDIVHDICTLVSQFSTADISQNAYNMFIGLHKLATEDYSYYFGLLNNDSQSYIANRLKNILKTSGEQFTAKFQMNAPEKYNRMFAAYALGGFVNIFLEWIKSEDKQPIELAAKTAGMLLSSTVKSIDEITAVLDSEDFADCSENLIEA